MPDQDENNNLENEEKLMTFGVEAVEPAEDPTDDQAALLEILLFEPDARGMTIPRITSRLFSFLFFMLFSLSDCSSI